MNQIITIDGPSGSGKSTVSRLLAKKLNFLYLDTGAMYRAVALQAKRSRTDLSDKKELRNLCMDLDLNLKADGEEIKVFIGKDDVSLAIRTPEMDMLSSRISAIIEVRESMTDLQRRIGKGGRIVAEGRDMGTVVFPDADFKFFITASPEVRARRRYKERISRGESISLEVVESELRKRDHQDKTRSIAPLRPAEDAKIIETNSLNPNQVIDEMLFYIKK